LLGFIRYDNTQHQETEIPHSSHYHSNTRDLIVCDDDRRHDNVLLLRWKEGAIQERRILCEHACTRQIQQLHVHARFTPDNRQVLFTSDKGGYGSPYLVPVPEDIESL